MILPFIIDKHLEVHWRVLEKKLIEDGPNCITESNSHDFL